MTDQRTLIVGASQAGVQLAASLRELGDTAPITLVGDEDHRPYQRPPLSKGWLKGDLVAEDVIFRNRSWYTERDIDLITGDAIVHIDRDASGGTARTAGGRVIEFTRLALTTGAAARTLPLGGDLTGVYYLRDADHALALQPALERRSRIVVIGGGFIGLEVAASARALGHHVTVLEMAPRLIGRAVSEETSAFYLAAHQRRGVTIILNARIARLTDDAGRVSGVQLDDGTVLPADMVVVGVGVVPRVELAEQLGLDVANGVVVDAQARTSDGVTVAAGDCAQMPNPYVRGTGDSLRLESVDNAIQQAKVAAATLLGHDATYRSVPWFWSDQADIKLQIAGLSTGYDQTVVRGDQDAEKFTVLYYRRGLLIAADCINNPAEFLALRQALTKGLTIPADAARDTTVPLKKSVIDVDDAVGA